MKAIICFVLTIFLISSILADCDSGQIDINSASLERLDEIIWVGLATAQKIVDARPFDCVDDLIKISGIGEVKIASILNQNLACVKSSSMEDEKTKKEKETEAFIEGSFVSNLEPEIGSVIFLSPKDIKSEENGFNKDKLAKAGLMMVSLILLCLFAFRFKKKWNQKKLREL